jgi:hypothetical protein
MLIGHAKAENDWSFQYVSVFYRATLHLHSTTDLKYHTLLIGNVLVFL